MVNLIIAVCMGIGEGEWELLEIDKDEHPTDERH